jgi:glutamate 5-kinase
VITVRGTIVIHADAGRALRKKRVALLTTHVLNCAGDFRAGDKVYVVVRGEDGGQGVVATGIIRCDAAVLQQGKGRSIDQRDIPIESNEPVVLIPEQDLELLWPSRQ